MPDNTREPQPIVVARSDRPPVPDAEKMMLTPLNIGLRTIEPYLTPDSRAAIVAQFRAHLDTVNHPILVSNAFVDAVCRAGFPMMSLPEARLRLARLSVAQYQQSILGRVMLAPIRLMGMERVLKQIPRQFAATTNYGTRWVATLGPQHWLLEFEDELMHPETPQGSVEAVGEFVGVKQLRVAFTLRAPRHYAYDITWSNS